MMTTLRISISIDMLDYEITNSVQWHLCDAAIYSSAFANKGLRGRRSQESRSARTSNCTPLALHFLLTFVGPGLWSRDLAAAPLPAGFEPAAATRASSSGTVCLAFNSMR